MPQNKHASYVDCAYPMHNMDSDVYMVLHSFMLVFAPGLHSNNLRTASMAKSLPCIEHWFPDWLHMSVSLVQQLPTPKVCAVKSILLQFLQPSQHLYPILNAESSQ